MLRLGTLPAVATRSDDDAKDMLRTYADTYLREEIQAEALVRNLGGFARFLDVVAAQAGELLNHSAVARDADVANRTVIEYVQVLEDTLVGFRLPPWTRSLRARLVAHPKLYLFDNGVTNALRGRLDAGIDPVERGRLFEHWVVQEVRRLCDYHHPETRMYFWRTHNGAEVDLLLERHGRLRVAVEVKARAAVVSADLSGLRSFGDVHPDVPRVLVCTAARPSLCGDVLVLPQRDFFERLEDWLA
jgi:predicted AAA+ superfamily ATPase